MKSEQINERGQQGVNYRGLRKHETLSTRVQLTYSDSLDVRNDQQPTALSAQLTSPGKESEKGSQFHL